RDTIETWKVLHSCNFPQFQRFEKCLLRIRNPLLYPIELQAHYFQCFASTSFSFSYFVEGLCKHFIIINQIYIVNKITKAEQPDCELIVSSKEMTLEKTHDFASSRNSIICGIKRRGATLGCFY
ncbi:hypothetical protein AMJ83_11570, partial [candidate division WOR_3 bacterium SM23_42]